jgi:hypothetical protein
MNGTEHRAPGEQHDQGNRQRATELTGAQSYSEQSTGKKAIHRNRATSTGQTYTGEQRYLLQGHEATEHNNRTEHRYQITSVLITD